MVPVQLFSCRNEPLSWVLRIVSGHHDEYDDILAEIFIGKLPNRVIVLIGLTYVRSKGLQEEAVWYQSCGSSAESIEISKSPDFNTWEKCGSEESWALRQRRY